MREDLLGYLLGALEPDEMQQIDEALQRDPALRAELDQLSAALRILDESSEIYEPPGDLVARAMAAIPTTEPAADRLGAGQAGPERLANLPAGSLSPASAPGRDGGWRLIDVFAISVSSLLLAGLLLPSILRERAAARNDACQEQLRQAGIALLDFLMRSSDRRFPQLELAGPEAFAGLYAVELADADLIPENRPLWCPSLEVPANWLRRSLPTSEQLRTAGPMELAIYHEGAGGHYAYSLGILENGRYVAPRFSSRPYFAILGDAPIHTLDGWTTAHEGGGFNILYEDGHVSFVGKAAAMLLGDHPFLNRSGEVEAGMDPNDAALAPSHTPPFTFIRNQ